MNEYFHQPVPVRVVKRGNKILYRENPYDPKQPSAEKWLAKQSREIKATARITSIN